MNLFELPAAQAVQGSRQNLGRTGALPSRILIVEDERVLAKNMKSYLSRGGSDVRTAASAAQALEMIATFAPDAVVLDYGLPDVDGLQTYAELVRRQSRRMEGVLITGNPTVQLERDARELGIRHVIGKPFRIADLERLLAAANVATADAPVGVAE